MHPTSEENVQTAARHARARDHAITVERVQIGVRMEKRMVKVLKALAEYLDMSLGDLLEGMTLHAFANRLAFTEETLGRVEQLKQVYGMDYGLQASHGLVESLAVDGEQQSDTRWGKRSEMKDVVLLGRYDEILEIPAETWRAHLERMRQHPSERLAFMTPEHHRVRYLAVSALPRNEGKPLAPEYISHQLQLPIETVKTVLDDLQKHLFFLVLDRAGDVEWAFPVTVEKTPHHLHFSTGEDIYAAWAEDALATPFVQGRLRNEYLTVEVESECAHCGRKLHFVLDSDLNGSVQEADAGPLLFEPDVDWKNFAKPNIIGDYWKNTLFFWSEEHARAFRKGWQQVSGIYMSLEQGLYATRIAQSSLFGFKDR